MRFGMAPAFLFAFLMTGELCPQVFVYVESDRNLIYSYSLDEGSGARVEGRVVDQEGVALGGVRLTPYRNPSSSARLRGTRSYAAVSSDIDGRFVIDGLPPGRYLLRVRFANDEVPPVKFELDSQAVDIGDIQFPKRESWSRYHGQLLDSEGNRVVNKTATIDFRKNQLSALTVSRKFSTDDQGKFTLFPFIATDNGPYATVHLPRHRRTAEQITKKNNIFHLRRDPASFSNNTSELTCTLVIKKKQCRVNEPVDLQVEIKNESDDSVFLVDCLDGSEDMKRFPHCFLEIDGKLYPEVIRLCQFKTPLTDSQFHEVGSQEIFLPRKLRPIQVKFQKPGNYRLKYVYDTSEKDPVKWRGRGAHPHPIWQKYDARWDPYIRAVPKVRLESAIVEISVSE